MFISVSYHKYLGSKTTPKEISWEYKVVDSEFEVLWVGSVSPPDNLNDLKIIPVIEASIMNAVIKVYEKKNLNVAANLIKALLYQSKISYSSIADIIEYNKKYNPKFAKYEEEINKYLILI